METKREYLEMINFYIKSAKDCEWRLQNFYITAVKYYLYIYRKKFIDNE